MIGAGKQTYYNSRGHGHSNIDNIYIAFELENCVECKSIMADTKPRDNRRATRGQRAMLFLRDGGKCHYCNVMLDINTFHADHIVPYYLSRNSELSNLVSSCYMCNVAKHTLSYKRYKQLLNEKGLDWRRRKYFATINNFK